MNLGILSLSLILISSELVHSKDKEIIIKNSVGIEMVLIPAGSFLMGSPNNSKEALDEEKPQHKVIISKPFYIGKYEVTQEQWEAVMKTDSNSLPKSNSFFHLPGMEKRIRNPKNPANMSWNDAQEFVNKLNQKEGVNKYRLPTEAEWEYAARAGTTTDYSFGNNKNDLKDYAWYDESFAFGSTHPVGLKKPNPWGLFDVHGNVWEWVQDNYSKKPYTADAVTDPKGPQSGSTRVVRGGSWHSTSDSWRTAFRKPYAPDYRGISIGLRLVKNIE